MAKIRVTYEEYKAFWAALDAVPGHKDNWYEDDVPSFPEDAKPTDAIVLDYGYLAWQGDGEELHHPLIKNGGDWVASFRAWKKSLNYRVLQVTVPKDGEAEFRELMKQRGWKVSGG